MLPLLTYCTFKYNNEIINSIKLYLMTEYLFNNSKFLTIRSLFLFD